MVKRELSRARSLVILGAWGALMHVAYSKQRKKDAKNAKLAEKKDRSKILRPENRKSWKDHWIVSYLVENGTVWLSVLVRLNLFAPPGQSSALSTLVSALWNDRWNMMAQWYLVRHFYSHIPYFKGSEPKIRPFGELFTEFMYVIGISSTQLVWVRRKLLPKRKSGWSLRKDLRNIGFLSFSAKLAIVRTVVDSLFFAGHWVIHRPFLYNWVHKLHHEDVWVNPTSNQHFSIIDFFVEALIPAFLSITTLVALKIKTSLLEQSLLLGYVGYLESQSHAGKPSSVSTLIAPIAPLYHYILGDIDRRNVEFHQVHHERRKCNYSITQWCDNLFGTTRFY